MKTLQQKLAEFSPESQAAIQKRFEELKQLFLEGKVIFPNTTDLLEELDYLDTPPKSTKKIKMKARYKGKGKPPPYEIKD